MILELSIFPLDKGGSLSPYVARAVKIIRESGLPHVFGPMGTCIEGDWNELSALAGKCLKALQDDSDRVVMHMKADWSRGREKGLTEKTASVEAKLER